MGEAGLVVRAPGEGERRWFAGGGLHTWKATAEDTGGVFLFFEDRMEAGKTTPLHTHPDTDESFYVLDGEIVVHADGVEHTIGSGGFVCVPRGMPHAFMTRTDTLLLCLQTPGTGQAFYYHASDSVDGRPTDGPVDFERVRAVAAEHGGVVILGPPPFAATLRA